MSTIAKSKTMASSLVKIIVSIIFISMPLAQAMASTKDAFKAADYFAAHNYKAALPIFEDIVRDEPGNSRARYYLALTYLKLGQNEKATIHFSEVIGSAPGSDEARYSQMALSQLRSKAAPVESATSKTVPSAAATAAATPVITVQGAPIVDRDFEAANSEAELIKANAKREADRLDAEADQMAKDMASVGAAKGRGKAYSQTAIDAATQDLRKNAADVRARGQREFDDVMMRAKLRLEAATRNEPNPNVSRPVSASRAIERPSVITLAPNATATTHSANITNYATNSSIGRIDEVSYWHQIKGLVGEQDCARALMLKPKFRGDMLSGRTSVSAIESNYSNVERTADERWIAAHQSAQQAFKPEVSPRIVVSGYDINQFVGLRSGPAGRLSDSDGICYKIFFDFTDAPRDLTPSLYMQFVRALANAGFVGDSKICMQPGFVRFFYNDIIVHTASPESAKLAESIGLSLFGTRLAHYARGVDVLQTKVGGRWTDPVDWHHFLAKSTDLSRLTPAALKFVENEN